MIEREFHDGDTFMTVAARFWRNVEIRGAAECWPWTGALDTGGYGRFKIGEKHYGAHRIARQVTHGDVRPGSVVCHSCDNPRCANPAHLSVGTQADNIRDRNLRGRTAKGPRNGRWKPELHCIPC